MISSKNIFQRPSSIFLFVWIAALYFHSVLPESLSVEIQLDVLILLISLYLIMLSFEILLLRVNDPRGYNLKLPPILRNVFLLGTTFYFVGYAANILYSGGLPIFWQLFGGTSSYDDWGIPSFSGMLFSLRALLVVVYVIYIEKKFINNLIFFILILCPFLELSRGGILFLFSHFLFAVLISSKISFKTILGVAIAIPMFIYFFAVLGMARYSSIEGFEIEDLAAIFDIDPDKNFLFIRIGFIWIARYLGTPINNVFFFSESGFEPIYNINFSIISYIPSFVREAIFINSGFPFDLRDEAYNASSFLAPFLADFGFLFSIIPLSLIFLFISFSFARFKNGSHFHRILMPAHLSVISLSIFSNYFTSLPYLFYPIILVLLSVLFKKHKTKLSKTSNF